MIATVQFDLTDPHDVIRLRRVLNYDRNEFPPEDDGEPIYEVLSTQDEPATYETLEQRKAMPSVDDIAKAYGEAQKVAPEKARDAMAAAMQKESVKGVKELSDTARFELRKELEALVDQETLFSLS